MFYYFEIRDTDGNNCRVYDCVVEAENEDKAYDEVQASIKAAYPNDDEDGSGGTYHVCDCEEPEEPECEGHGGITVSDAQEFATEDEAEAECASYHSTWHI